MGNIMTPAKQRRAREWRKIYAYYIASINQGHDSDEVIKECANKFGHVQSTIMRVIIAKGELNPSK